MMIILLTLPEDCTFERVKQRSNGDEDFAQGCQIWGKIAFDPVKEEEECVHVLEIEEQMTGKEVVNKMPIGNSCIKVSQDSKKMLIAY